MRLFYVMIRLCWATAFCLLGTAALRGQEPSPIPSPSVTATPEATESPVVAPTATPQATPKVLYPSTNLSNLVGLPSSNNGTAGAGSLGTTFLVLVAFCGVGYYFLRRHPSFAVNLRAAPRKLTVSESRSLGNRQFLVVVEYESERMLLGVTPGKIDYLCPLRGPQGEHGAFPPVKEANT